MVAATNIIILPQPGSTDDLERTVKRELILAQHATQEALDSARQAQAHWLNFYDSCRQLQDIGAHTSAGKSWRKYFCDLTGLKDDSRFRQLKRVAAHARLIEAETGICPCEWELRDFPLKAIPVDKPQLVISTFEAAKQTALVRAQMNGKKVSAPNAADYKVANEVIADIVANRGVFLPELNATFAVDALIENHILEHANSLRDSAIRHSEYESVERYVVTGADIKITGLRNKPATHVRSRRHIRNQGRIHIQVQQLKEE